jgi:PEP-CTERM motif
VRRLIHAFAFATMLLGLPASHASAGFVVNLSNVNVGPGGTGTMNITVTSTTAYTLSSFGLELQIAPIGTPTSVLQFDPSMAQPTAPFGNGNYVFHGNSFDQDFSTPFWSVPNSNPMLTAVGGDMDDSGSGYVSIGASTTAFLAAVQFAAPAGATLGDQFQISLVNNPNFTYFDDLNGNPLAGGYSMTGGVVTVASSVVPEPSSLVITLSGLGGLLGAWCGRRMGKSRGLW